MILKKKTYLIYRLKFIFNTVQKRLKKIVVIRLLFIIIKFTIQFNKLNSINIILED